MVISLNLAQAERNKVYIILEGNTTLQKDDHVWLSDEGHLCCVEGKGWLEQDELDDTILSLKIKAAKDYEIIKMNGSEICRRIGGNT